MRELCFWIPSRKISCSLRSAFARSCASKRVAARASAIRCLASRSFDSTFQRPRISPFTLYHRKIRTNAKVNWRKCAAQGWENTQKYLGKRSARLVTAQHKARPEKTCERNVRGTKTPLSAICAPMCARHPCAHAVGTS